MTRAGLSEEKTEIIRKGIRAGLQVRTVCELAKVSSQVYYRIKREMGYDIRATKLPTSRSYFEEHGKDEIREAIEHDLGPIRPAMYALAEFDKVIARALHTRLNPKRNDDDNDAS